ncbi:MAG: hypothetical protein ACREJE_01990 [Candidatus Rokuibacteriota bacterium]
MADVLTVIAKIRAAKGKGDALAALLKEQVAAVSPTSTVRGGRRATFGYAGRVTV